MTDRRLPDKAIDLMDEAAAKLRVAMYLMPPALVMKAQLAELQNEGRKGLGGAPTTKTPPVQGRQARAPSRG